MAFFKKLKDQLFKSSSKIEEGLDAIVEDGGVEEDVDTVQPLDVAAIKAAEIEAQAAVVAQQDARLAEAAREREAAARAVADQARIEAEDAARLAAQVAQDEADAKALAVAKSAADAADVARLQAEREVAARMAQAERQAEIAKQEIEAREAELARQANAAAAEAASRAEDARLEAERAAQEQAAKPGLIGRLLGRGEKKTIVRRELDDDMLERLEELLISADMGVDTALRVTSNMAEGRFGKRLSTQEIKELLAAEITRIMEPVARPLPLYPTKPQVVLVVGVNGSGKTTTIGKLASQFQAAGKKVVIAAGDTFRAAAVEQLQVWGDRAGVPVLTAPEGSDPASLAYDAMEQAARDGADLLMIDTAGRLQNRADLMEELQKIVRVIRKKDPDAPHNTLLVLDATTGQNALSQVKTFQELADVSGLIMTKLDGTAKGGVLVALADKFGLPIHAIGIGEQIDDLAPFDPEDFAAALTGLDR
jgi:fused signal recognition particle receptor